MTSSRVFRRVDTNTLIIYEIDDNAYPKPILMEPIHIPNESDRVIFPIFGRFYIYAIQEFDELAIFRVKYLGYGDGMKYRFQYSKLMFEVVEKYKKKMENYKNDLMDFSKQILPDKFMALVLPSLGKNKHSGTVNLSRNALGLAISIRGCLISTESIIELTKELLTRKFEGFSF